MNYASSGAIPTELFFESPDLIIVMSITLGGVAERYSYTGPTVDIARPHRPPTSRHVYSPPSSSMMRPCAVQGVLSEYNSAKLGWHDVNPNTLLTSTRCSLKTLRTILVKWSKWSLHCKVVHMGH